MAAERANLGVKEAMTELARQFNPEHFKQSPDLVCQIDALCQHGLTAWKQSADVVTRQALHMNPAIPAGVQNLRNAARIILVRIIAHRRRGC
jgi:hypothetical protein